MLQFTEKLLVAPCIAVIVIKIAYDVRVSQEGFFQDFPQKRKEENLTHIRLTFTALDGSSTVTKNTPQAGSSPAF
jgi:hypothetical protein